MRQDFVNTQVLKMLRQRNMSLIFGVGMLLCNIVLCFGLMFKTEKVVLVPPEINKTFWVTNKEVAPEYLEVMGRFLGQMLLNQSPSSAKHNRDILLKYVSPKFYGALNHKLMKQEKYMLSNDLATRFSLHEIEASTDTNKVVLTGEQTSYIAQKEVKKELVSYEITFDHNGLKYLVDDFKKIGKEDEEILKNS